MSIYIGKSFRISTAPLTNSKPAFTAEIPVVMLTALVSRFPPPEHIKGIIQRVGKLTPSQIDEYFDTHLPYRIRILLAHYRMTRESWTGDPGRLDACFVAALVTARLFLNLLGIGKDKTGAKLSRYRPHPDDVTADDLGGLLIDPATLPAHEQKLFLDFLRMADKAAAHFTLPITHEWSRTHDVVLGVHHHLKVCSTTTRAGRFETLHHSPR